MLENKILDLLNPILEEANAYLVELNIKGDVSNKIVEIFVDTDEGIVLDQCTKISKRLGFQMEELDIMQYAYRLEVSSPGLSRPITHPRQLAKALNKTLDVTYMEEGNKKTDTFDLIEVTETSLRFKKGKTEQTIDKQNVVKVTYHLKW